MAKLLQWNILADGLGNDGFLSTEFEPIRENSKPNAKSYQAVEFMTLVREAKLSDKSSGVLKDMNDLKKEGKKLKSIKSKDSSEYKETQSKVASLKAKIDQNSKLVQLKEQFKDSPELEKIDQDILSWELRYDRLKKIALAVDPDIITFQELDHLQQFTEDPDFNAKYTCFVDDDTLEYNTPIYTDDPAKDERRPENYLSHVLASRTSFAPKSYSHAYNFRKKRKDGSTDVDDDGVAIFWKKDRFQPLELGFLKLPSDGEKSEAVVAVVLVDEGTGAKFNVLTTHLPSGDETKKEVERLKTLRDINAEWKASRIRLNKASGAWEENDYGGIDFNGILSFVKYYSDSYGTTTIFALDANSRPTFPLTKVSEEEKATNVWQQILSYTGLESVWTKTKFIKAVDGTAVDKDLPYVVSVNKMRGPASQQPGKIGEHQLELIDHVYTNGNTAKLVNTVTMADGETIKMAPLQYKGKEGKAELELNPTSKMPSDHLPVAVEISVYKASSWQSLSSLLLYCKK